MKTLPTKIGTFKLKNGKIVDAYNTCCLDGYMLYYQNEVFSWESCPVTEIMDFGQLMYAGNFPAAI